LRLFVKEKTEGIEELREKQGKVQINIVVEKAARAFAQAKKELLISVSRGVPLEQRNQRVSTIESSRTTEPKRAES
jgi:hypothetical protein